MSTFNFPENFVWGTATAGHQVEGNNNNNEVWVLEHLPATPFREPSGIACDHFNRYPQDIALLADLGFNSYRFSVEWARIEPQEGEFSQEALDHYRRVLATCHEHGIQPMVTFHHFTSPIWLHQYGGWLSDKTPDYFARFCEKSTAHFGDLIAGACTFNEPNLPTLLKYIVPFDRTAGPWWGQAAEALKTTPDNLGLFQFVDDPKMWDVVSAAHRKAYEVLHAGPGDFPVGLTLAFDVLQAAEGGEEKLLEIRHRLLDRFIERLHDDDFIGVQNYSRLIIGPEGPVYHRPPYKRSQMMAEIYPASIGGAIRMVAEQSDLPIYVTENGIATDNDVDRVNFYNGAVQSIAECIQDGIDVRGYYAWSMMDNFEWNSGYSMQFGIVSVDRETMERTAKPSAHRLGEIARQNSIEMPSERATEAQHVIPVLPTSLPDKCEPYLLRDREGARYLIGTQLVTVLASGTSSGDLFELVSISGAYGDNFPTHRHANSHEGIYVTDGMVEVQLGEALYLLAPGDYAHIPAGTPHAYKLCSHDARFLSLTSKGAIGKIYSAIGTKTDLHVRPPQGDAVDLANLLAQAAGDADIELVESTAIGDAQRVTNLDVPDGVVPYVIASGGGTPRIVGHDVFFIMASNDNTDGQFLVLDNVGPKGHAIVQHFHQEHTETFLCTAGKMTMWANDRKYELLPGDFLHVPAGTKHSFRMDAHYTRFFSVLASGIFEEFFHTLGSPYEGGTIFPTKPGPARFDRLAKKVMAGELDLKIVGPPPDGL